MCRRNLELYTVYIGKLDIIKLINSLLKQFGEIKFGMKH